jgi:hypothetical protein
MALTPDILNDPRAVPLDLLRRYLVANGWRRADPAGRVDVTVPTEGRSQIIREMLEGRSGGRRNFDQFVLSEPGLNNIELVIPRETASPDYLRQIRGAIRTLSDIEGRAPEHVIADVNQIGFDVLRSCFPRSMILDETISLSAAAHYASRVHTLLATVAHTEMWPVLLFPRLSKAALEYANQCRFGHTFRGSFGFTIGSPIASPETNQVARPGLSRPLARRVVERFARGVAEVCSVIDGGDEAILMDNAELGFGANGYRRFAELIDGTAASGLVLSFAFSPEWGLPPDMPKAKAFSVDRRHSELSKSVAETLRIRHDAKMTDSLLASMDDHDLSSDDGGTTTVIGEVVRLARDDQSGNVADPNAENEIAVQWQRRELGNIRVWIPLGRSDYEQALEAHRLRWTIRVRGTLSRNGQFWLLLNPAGFTVI